MKRTAVVVLLVCLVAVPAAVWAGGATGQPTPDAPSASTALDPASVSYASDGTRIAYFSLGGRGYVTDQKKLVQDHPGPPYVWESESLELRPNVHTAPDNQAMRACGEILDAEGETVDEIGCNEWNATTQHRYPRIELQEWPPDTSGTHFLRVDLYEAVPAEDGSGTESVLKDRLEVEVYVISKDGDIDGDGLSNGREVELWTDFTRRDTDGDGLTDSREVYQYGTDPLASDTTGDGVSDGTVARLGLPPTVPYVVHAVAGLILLAGAGALVAGPKLRRALQSRRGPDRSGPIEGSPPVDGAGAAAVEEPRSKEDEIIGILRQHGGRMKQADLVEETDWSKATVSRLLSTLEDDGRVEKIRVGRGNVVQLTGTPSGLDDERKHASG
jgi:DNA-binding transcriptional ArsR family regulator